MANDQKRLTVIVGAGASHDCAANSQTDAHWRPPLVGNLFDNRQPSFNSVLRKYPGVESLADEIRGAVNAGSNLETVLRRFAESQSAHTKRHYLQVPLYLQELLGDVSTQYIQSGGSTFNTLVREIEESSYEKVLYLTVNYDLFLEQALAGHYGVSFQSISAYVPNEHKWRLVKLHGSVLWGRAVLNAPSESDVTRLLAPFGTSEMRLGPLEIRPNYKEMDGRFTAGTFYYPALAVPVDGKYGFLCEDDQVMTARRFLTGCSDFLVIGFSGLDDHVLELLKGVSCVNKLRVVNGSRSSAEQTIQKLSDVNSRFGGIDSAATDGGFAHYVGLGLLSEFLRAVGQSPESLAPAP